MSAGLLEVSGLCVELGSGDAATRLVEDVSFTLEEGEVLGLVGESGSGKSLTCRALMRLLPPRISISRGSVRIQGEELTALSEAAMVEVRGRRIGMIFQNPSSYLNPIMPVGDQIGESLRSHFGRTRKEALAEAAELLRQVGIPDAGNRLGAYVHEFSGGMRQRVMIAAALACRPSVLIADEPTTALDVTIQAQILRLLLDLKDRLGLSVILVTHDLSVVAQTCDRVAVMYAGRLLEQAPLRDLLDGPLHPYSRGLIASQPEATPPGRELPSIPGQPPLLSRLPEGCRFAPRCDLAQPACRDADPPLAAVSERRQSACLLWEALRPA